MNRRRFLAALASIPLVGRLVPKAQDMAQIVRYTGPAPAHRVGFDFLKKFYTKPAPRFRYFHDENHGLFSEMSKDDGQTWLRWDGEAYIRNRDT